jgi:hypothetical protein
MSGLTRSIATAACCYCDDTLYFEQGQGWRHSEGGLYVMECPDCGWSGAPRTPAIKCPKCGSTKTRDNHCALAVRS